MPCSWARKESEPAPVVATPEPARGGRGRGRGRGRGGKGNVGDGSSDNPPQQNNAPPRKRQPFLLTNLVRTGNQMGGATTWTLLQKSLELLISEKLVLAPMSSRAPDAAMENLKRNQHILSTLGKIPEDFDLNQMEQPQQQCGASKPSAVWETAAEFLRLGTSEIISDLLQIHIIS